MRKINYRKKKKGYEKKVAKILLEIIDHEYPPFFSEVFCARKKVFAGKEGLLVGLR